MPGARRRASVSRGGAIVVVVIERRASAAGQIQAATIRACRSLERVSRRVARRRAGWAHALRHPRAHAREVGPRGTRPGQGAGRPELRAEVGRLPRAGVVGRRERRDRQPRREAADPLLSRARRGVLAAAARAVPARRRGRRAQGRAGRAAPRLGVAHAAHPPRGIPREHARRDDAGDVHRVRPARPRRPRPAGRAVLGAPGASWSTCSPGCRIRSTSRGRRRMPTPPARWLSEFEGAGLDGVVAKPLAQPYAPNKRTMFKIKHARTADVVAMGYRIHKSGAGRRIAAGRAVLRGRARCTRSAPSPPGATRAGSSSSTNSHRSSSATKPAPRSRARARSRGSPRRIATRRSCTSAPSACSRCATTSSKAGASGTPCSSSAGGPTATRRRARTSSSSPSSAYDVGAVLD